MRILAAAFGLVLIWVGAALAMWLSIWVMLIGGIAQASQAWGVDHTGVAIGLARAILFEVGVIPGALVGALGGLFCHAAAEA